MNEEERYAEESLRERRVWRSVFIGGLVVTAIVLTFGWRFVSPRLESAKKFDRALSLVSQTEPSLSVLDSAAAAAAAAPSTATVGTLTALRPRLATARANLTEADALITAGMPRLADEEQQQATLVQVGVRARLAMLDAATGIISAAETAASHPSVANTAALKALVTDSASAYQTGKSKAAAADAAVKAL